MSIYCNCLQDLEGAVPLALSEGSIVFDNVSFGYAPGHLLLRNVSFKVSGGQTLAIVGGSGSGYVDRPTFKLLTS